MATGDHRRYADRRDEAGRSFSIYVRDQIKAAMLSKGRTNLRLASDSGIAETTLRRKMAGETPFNADEIDAIAGALDMSIAELLKSDGFVIVGDVTVEGDGNNVNIGNGNGNGNGG